MVQVQAIDGTPLMPCSEAKARHLLKQHRARRVKNNPFTIRLKFVVDGHDSVSDSQHQNTNQANG